MLGDLHRLVDGDTGGNVRHVQHLVHGHPHDGGGHQGDSLEPPALGIFFDVRVQLRRVLRHAGDETADILLLLGVGALLIDGMLRCQRSEALPAQLQVQKLLHRQVIEAQFIGEMCGDLAGRIACHKRVPFLSQFVWFS